jgi:hypothetical protein
MYHVGIFSPLANAYSNGIDELMHSSLGFSRITKRIFWSIFRAAWSKALTMENIKSAFESTGIHPIDSKKVLSQVGRGTPSPISSDSEPEETTPMSVRGVRRAVKAVGREHKVLDPKISKLIKATERLVIRNEILEHNNKNLSQALCTEKKRRKRGKPMGLVDKDNPSSSLHQKSPLLGNALSKLTKKRNNHKQRRPSDDLRSKSSEKKRLGS